MSQEVKSSKKNSDKFLIQRELPITRSGIFLNFADLFKDNPPSKDDLERFQKFRNKFTIVHRPIIGPMTSLQCCSCDVKKQRIVIPRFANLHSALKNFELKTKSEIKEGQKMRVNMKWKGELTPNQNIIVNHITNNVFTENNKKLGQSGLVLKLGTGQGKTFLAIYLASLLGLKTLIVLHTIANLAQWVNAFKAATENAHIGYYYTKEKTLADIMFIIIDSAVSNDFTFTMEELINENNYELTEDERKNLNDAYLRSKKSITPLEFYQRFGFIIYDEAHLYLNPQGIQAFQRAQAPYIMGLSATPDEHGKGFQDALPWFLGPILNAEALPEYKKDEVSFTGQVFRVPYKAKIQEFNKIHYKIYQGKQIIDASSMINQLCEDPNRDELVVECVKRCLKENHYTYVFADRREYLSKLKNKLQGGEIVTNDEEFVRVVGGATEKEFETAELKSKVIFTTYPYMGTGKSIPKMTAIVFATPRKAGLQQFVGRILRLGSDQKIKRQIYDIVDTTFSRQWNVRKKVYNEKGFTINEFE